MNPKVNMRAEIEEKCRQKCEAKLKEDFIRSEQCRYTGVK